VEAVASVKPLFSLPLSAGCTLCDKAYPSDCPDHGPVTFVPDTPIESRARLSLPKQLVLRQSIMGAEAGKKQITVYFYAAFQIHTLPEIKNLREFNVGKKHCNREMVPSSVITLTYVVEELLVLWLLLRLS